MVTSRLRGSNPPESVLRVYAQSSREHADMLREENVAAAAETDMEESETPLFPPDREDAHEPWVIGHHDAMAVGFAALAAGASLADVQATARASMASHPPATLESEEVVQRGEWTAEMLANTLRRVERDHGKRANVGAAETVAA